MLSALLKSDTAIKTSIAIMNVFVVMRKYISNNLLEQKYINNMVLKHDYEIGKEGGHIKWQNKSQKLYKYV